MQDANFLRPLLLETVSSPSHIDEHADELFDITLEEA